MATATKRSKRPRRDLEREWVAAADSVLDPLLTLGLDPARPLFPLDTAGMPPPGPDFDRLAQAMLALPEPQLITTGMSKEAKEAARAQHQALVADHVVAYGQALEALYRDALYTERFTLDVAVKGRQVPGPFVSGTTYSSVADRAKWGDYGPVQPYDVMVVSKYPGTEEVRKLMNFVGASSTTLFRAFHELGMADIRRVEHGEGYDTTYDITYNDLGEVGDWYFTNVCKHPGLDPSTTGLAATWAKNCAPLLEQELRLVRPKFILCFGTEATKAVLGKKASVGRMFGRIVAKRFALHREGAPPEAHQWHTAQVMSCVHPAYVGKKPEAYSDLVNGVQAFRQLIQGTRIGDAETQGHRTIGAEIPCRIPSR